jgi:hypothetical protein
MVARARVVLWSAEGTSNTEIASRLQWTKATVGKWRRRFIERRLAGLYDVSVTGNSRWRLSTISRIESPTARGAGAKVYDELVSLVVLADRVGDAIVGLNEADQYAVHHGVQICLSSKNRRRHLPTVAPFIIINSPIS